MIKKSKPMKAQELRIGNQIHINNLVTIVTSSDIKFIYERERFGWEIDNCTPIKISEEILLRLNFKYEYEKMLDKIYSYGSFRVALNKLEGCHYYHVDTKIGKSFHYLHQLQNLFYDLTGDTLTL